MEKKIPILISLLSSAGAFSSLNMINNCIFLHPGPIKEKHSLQGNPD